MRKRLLYEVSKHLIWNFALAALLCANSAVGQTILRPDGVAVTPKGIMLAKQVRTVLCERFDKKSGNYTIDNYKNVLDITEGNIDGRNCLIIINRDKARKKGRDTAWGINFIPVNLGKGNRYILNLDVRSGYSSSKEFTSYKDKYHNRILFYDANGKVIGEQKIVFRGSHPDFRYQGMEGLRPEKAVKAAVFLGADKPDMPYGSYFAFGEVKLSMIEEGNPYTAVGYYESQPFPLTPDHLTMKADCPAGTAVDFQIAYAPDKAGKPGKWYPFTGPDGKKEIWYSSTRPKKLDPKNAVRGWIKYKVRFTASKDRAKSPVLKSVTIGKIQESGWKILYEDQPPTVVRLFDSPTPDGMTPVKLRIDSRIGIDWSRLSIKYQKKNVTKQFVRKGNELTYTPDKPLSPGLHKFIVEVRDYSANVRVEKVYIFIGEKPQKGLASIREDGVTLIDGKPFFPIGFYNVKKQPLNHNSLPEAFRQLKAAGCNLVHRYNIPAAEIREFLDLAHKNGMYAWLAGVLSPNNPNLDAILAELCRVRLHPALLGWYIADDTESHNTPLQLDARAAAIRIAAPQLLSIQADIIGDRGYSRFRKFTCCTDVFMVEIYPVQGPSLPITQNCVARAIDDMEMWKEDIRVTGAKNRACWAIVQYFAGWGPFKFPTEHELRGMVWGSLIHGAKGIIYYTYSSSNATNLGCTSTPERFAAVSRVSREVRNLEKVLMLPDSPKQIVPKILAGPGKDYYGNPSVTCLLKEAGRDVWLFAVNASRGNVIVSFSMPAVKSGTRIGEKGPLSLQDSVLKDRFAPMQVHLYHFSR